MKLYHLTSIPSSSITCIVQGSFTAAKQQEVVTASSSSIELFRLLPKKSRLVPIIRLNTFSSIRSIAPFRLPATKRDYLLVTSDAGSLTILSADQATATFRTVHCETFGKTGVRRAVPAQYIACDPRGRACMIAALERTKFSFILNRDAQQNLTISSPLEAHKSNIATASLIALDAGFENPIFAAIERSYERDSIKQLVFYELDFGLNHIIRKHSYSVRPTTFLVFAVPGHTDGPGGLLLCSDSFITYKPYPAQPSNHVLEAPLPRRTTQHSQSKAYGDSFERISLVVSGTLYQDKKGKVFFFLLCTENGDLIKVDLLSSPDKGAHTLRLAYFDTLPAPATSMCIFRSGYLFAALEGSDSVLLRFREVHVADNDPAGGISKAVIDRQLADPIHTNGDRIMPNESASSSIEFRVRPKLKHLVAVGNQHSHAPFLGLSSFHTSDDQCLLLTASGLAENGRLSAIRSGIAVSELSDPYMFPSSIQGVFTLTNPEEADSFNIVVSLRDKTRCLRVSNGEVEDKAGTGLRLDTKTLFASTMASNSLIQMWHSGIRFLPFGSENAVSEWIPDSCQILAGCCNAHQVVIALSSGNIVRFDVDRETGVLDEVETISGAFERKGTSASLSNRPSLAVPDVDTGRTRSPFFAFADGVTNRVRLYRIGNDNKSVALGLHLAPAPVTSLALVDFANVDRGSAVTGPGMKTSEQPLMNILIGTNNGALLRISVDHLTGSMARKKTYFLGPHPVRTSVVRVLGIPVCLGLGAQPLVLYCQGGRVTSSPLCSSAVEYASAFSAPKMSEGFVVSAGPRLLLLALDIPQALARSALLPYNTPVPSVPSSTALHSSFRTSEVELTGTPRRLFLLKTDHEGQESFEKEERLLLVVEADHRRRKVLSEPNIGASTDENMGMDEVEVKTEKGFIGEWFARISLFGVYSRRLKSGDFLSGDGQSKEVFSYHDSKMFDSAKRSILDVCELREVSLPQGIEDAFTVVIASFIDNLEVSAVTGWRNRSPKSPIRTGLLTYYISKKTKKLHELHETDLTEPAQVVTQFRDMLLVGTGRSLRLYRIGKKRLLKRVDFPHAVQNKIVALAVAGGDRVFVGDVQESVTLYGYITQTQTMANGTQSFYDMPDGGKFVPIAADKVARWIVTMKSLDYSSVCCSDKFGNIAVLRLPRQLNRPASQSVVSSVGGGALVPGSRAVNDQLNTEAHFFVGSIVTGISVIPGHDSSGDNSRQFVIYNTMDGSIGTIVPLRNHADGVFAEKLEREMRSRYKSVCGRDHISYRSSFYPVKNMVDGDLCHMFSSLSQADKVSCAEAVGRTADDIEWKLDEMRNLALS